MNRRVFLSAAGATLAAPYLMKFAGSANAQALRVRRNLQTLPANDPFFAKYAAAITKMHQLPASDPRSWRAQAMIHPNFCPHGTDQFAQWHRPYLVNFEKICGSLIGDPSFALPYWDWTMNRGRLPAAFDSGALNVASWNDPSNLNSPNWGPINTTGVRFVSSTRGVGDDPQRSGAFTPRMIATILSQSSFDLFQPMLEGSPHNNGHVISGGRNGHMASGLSPLDPIFWLHHCNVDRILARWQRAGNDAPDLGADWSGQFVDENGRPVSVRSADVLDFEAMGYTYDDFVAPSSKVAALAAPSEAEQTALAGRSVSLAATIIGTAENNKASKANVATSIPVTAGNLVDTLSKARTFRPAGSPAASKRLAVEGSRILARLTVMPPDAGNNDLIVNVFVNCPYLSPQTDASDPHFAGSFGFFGGSGGHHHGSFKTVVDLTDALRDQLKDGLLATENVNVQLLPLPAAPGAEAKGNFTVTSVELLSS